MEEYRIEKAPLKKEILIRLIDMILSGKFLPGDKLPTEKELTEMFNISRPSLRESLRALSAMGIIEVRHGNGMYVTSLEPDILFKPFDFLLRHNNDNLKALFQARKILEEGIIGLSAKMITNEDLFELQKCLQKDEEYINNNEFYMENDRSFHTTIYNSSKNKILILLMQSVRSLIRESQNITSQDINVRKKTLEHHKKIFIALEEHDVKKAQSAMLEHLSYLEEQIQ